MAKLAKSKEDWEMFADKDTAEIYNIITNQNYYSPKPLTSDDLNPDLVIRWRVPKQ